MPRTEANWITSSILKRSSIRPEELIENPSLILKLPPLLPSLRAFLQGDWGPIIARDLETQWGQTPYEFFLQALEIADDYGIPAIDIPHPPCLHASSNLQVLELARARIEEAFGENCEIQVLKTVTVSFTKTEGDFHHFLVTGFGDFTVDKPLLKGLASLVDASAKHTHLNNEEVFDPDLEIKVVPGLVKPILQPDSYHHLDGICFLHLTDPSTVGAVTTTLTDSFLTQVGVLERAMEWYWSEFCQQHGVKVKKVDDSRFENVEEIYLLR